jgi:hypothetical protein
MFIIFGGAAAYSGIVTFPKNFMLGASTAAYKIEGAWNESGELKFSGVLKVP